jgi:fluoroacetyl-CoA thioesterase
MSETTLGPGASGSLEWVVEDKHCTVRGDRAVFSTPSLVLLLEGASVEALRPYLQLGQASVGTRVDVRHLAPTPKGMRVVATATVREVDRRRVSFDVVVDDEVERIGEASHERFIIDINRFSERLEQKLKQT